MLGAQGILRLEAEELEEDGVSFFKIEDGFFYSTRRAPQLTIPMNSDAINIARGGDGLLRVFCDKGTVSLWWPYGRVDEEGNEAPVLVGSHIEVFKDGYPLENSGKAPLFRKSDPEATVWATYELYGPKHQEILRTYADSSDEDKGLKMRYGEEVWQIVGKKSPGHFVNTIRKLNRNTIFTTNFSS